MGIVDIIVEQGTTFVIQIQLKNADTLAPIPVTGYEFVGGVSQTFYDEADIAFRFEVIDEVNGIIHAILDANLTDTLDYEKGVYDIDYILPVSKEKFRLIKGDVSVNLGGLG